jgi:5'-phosphate synthase pdxT subunit
MEKIAGIIAFQGGVEEHIAAFKKLGGKVKKIRTVRDLRDVTHLVIPGGESTVIGRFLKSSGLAKEIIKAVKAGKMAVWGTCAGAILLGHGASPYSMDLIDISLIRNAYGRQIDSFTKIVTLENRQIEAVFIRAPIISKVALSVKVLAKDGKYPILCSQKKILVSTFHPELTASPVIHKYFLENF